MSARLYVGNLSYDTDADRLISMFADYGIVASRPHIVMDRESNRSKGFGFVEVGSDSDADLAISQMNGARIDGRSIRVDRALEKPRNEGGGGGKGGGFGGGGGRRDDGRREHRGRDR